jgi:hypothetical protein
VELECRNLLPAVLARAELDDEISEAAGAGRRRVGLGRGGGPAQGKTRAYPAQPALSTV